MVTLDYKLMLSLSLWQYNHHPDEGLTSGLFQKTFGPVDGKHYYEKWTGYFNRNLWDMIAYFRGEGENGQKFCDMIAAQVELYTKNRFNENNSDINNKGRCFSVFTRQRSWIAFFVQGGPPLGRLAGKKSSSLRSGIFFRQALPQKTANPRNGRL